MYWIEWLISTLVGAGSNPCTLEPQRNDYTITAPYIIAPDAPENQRARK